MRQTTYTPSLAETGTQWWVVDAREKTLGRLASQIALVLRGKHRPDYTPHLDMGDHVVVVNAKLVRVTGSKLEQKMYYRHTGYPGGIRARPLAEMLAKHPDRVIRHAVKGMLPGNRLAKQLIGKLKVYGGPDHPHAAQAPLALDPMGSLPIATATAVARGEAKHPAGGRARRAAARAAEKTLTDAAAESATKADIDAKPVAQPAPAKKPAPKKSTAGADEAAAAKTARSTKRKAS